MSFLLLISSSLSISSSPFVLTNGRNVDSHLLAQHAGDAEPWPKDAAVVAATARMNEKSAVGDGGAGCDRRTVVHRNCAAAALFISRIVHGTSLGGKRETIRSQSSGDSSWQVASSQGPSLGPDGPTMPGGKELARASFIFIIALYGASPHP